MDTQRSELIINTRPTYHVVSHTHWDREWYLSFEEFRGMLVMLVDDLLELLRSNPGFKCFTLDGQAIVFEDYLRVRPDRRDELRSLIREGRLFVGPWYVLADEFLTSAESTVRNLLIGKHECSDMGAWMNVGYLPDTFSHIAMMPAILTGFGIDNVILWRGFGGEPGQETSEYFWKGHDGSGVLMTHLSKFGYSAGYVGDADPDQVIELFERLRSELDRRATTSQRLWLNGGDHHWPDKSLPQALQILSDRYDVEFMHSNLIAYTERLKREAADLPEISGELRFGFHQAFAVQGGVYSSRMYIKQANAACQHLLERYIEPLNALSVLSGNESRLPLVTHAWKTLLQNHPHDSICATSIDSVHDEMMTRFKRVNEIAETIKRFCLNDLLPAAAAGYRDDTCLYIFNMSPFDRTEVVEANIDFFLQDVVVGLNPDVKIDAKRKPVGSFTLLDPEGMPVPYEILKREETFGISYSKAGYPKQTAVERFTVRLFADEIPAFGYTCYRIDRNKKGKHVRDSSLRTGHRSIENSYLKVEVTSRGLLVMTDKETGLVYRDLNKFEDGGDIGDEYNYCPPQKDRIIDSSGSRPKIKIRKSSLSVSITVEYALKVPVSATANRKSRSGKLHPLVIRSAATLKPDSRRLDIETEVDNNNEDHRLRVCFASGVRNNKSYADTPFAVVERQHINYKEKDFPIEIPPRHAPMSKFVTVRGNGRCLTIISKGLPEYDVFGDRQGTVALTLLRCVGSISYGDLKTRRGGEAAWKNLTPGAQCRGKHRFEYSILPQADSEPFVWDRMLQEVESYITPPFVWTGKGEGETNLKKQWLKTDMTGCIFSACKESEDRAGIILRWYNPGDAPRFASIVSAETVHRASVVRLDETVVAGMNILNGNSVELTSQERSISTVKLER